MYSVLKTIESTDSPDVDLASLDAVKSALGITGSAEDTTLQTRITNASRTLLAICDLVTPATDYVETFYFEPCDQMLSFGWSPFRPARPLTLSRMPVNSLASITVDDNDIDTDDDVIVDNEVGQLRLLGNAPWNGTVVVAYNAGYEFPDRVPGPLLTELIELVQDARVMASMSADAGGQIVSTIRHGDEEVSYSKPVYGDGAGAISAAMMARLSRYRRPAAF